MKLHWNVVAEHLVLHLRNHPHVMPASGSRSVQAIGLFPWRFASTSNLQACTVEATAPTVKTLADFEVAMPVMSLYF
jgi:hypothetical protein